MEKFSRTLRGYNPDEVNSYLDDVIKRFDKVVKDSREKDVYISNINLELKRIKEENISLKNKLSNYQNVQSTLNNETSNLSKMYEQIKSTWELEREAIIFDAKTSASRIVNEALLKSEKIEYEANNIRKNTINYKRKLRSILESQMELIDDIETIDI